MLNALESCKICGDIFKNGHYRNRHLKKCHSITFENYIIKYIFDGIQPTCKCGCGKYTNFNGRLLLNWYSDYYNQHQPHYPRSSEMKEKILLKNKDTFLKKYGVTHPMKNKDIREKTKKTNLERYGVENALQNENIKNKLYNTNLERYGVRSTLKISEVQEKIKNTNLEKYGFENAFKNSEIRTKAKKTNIKRYGVEYPLQNTEIKDKSVKTNIEKYGVDTPFKSDIIKNKIKNTNLEKYGVNNYMSTKNFRMDTIKFLKDNYDVDNIAQVDEIKEKMKMTNIERYGVEYPIQNPEIKQKFKTSMLEKYGIEYFFNSKNFKKNYSIQKSKKELEVCRKLNGESGFMFKGKEYDIKIGNNLFEIDGDYYHVDKLINLNITQLNSCVNDFNKINDCKDSEYTLYKIFISNLPKEITVENLIKNSYVPNFELHYDDVIMSSEYLFYYISNNKIVSKLIPPILKFIKTFKISIINQYSEKMIRDGIENIIIDIINGSVINLTLNNICKYLK